MEKKIKSKIEIKLTEGERDLLYFYLLGVYSLEDIETFEEYPAVVDKLEESITEVAKSTRRRRGVESKIEKIELVNHDLIVDFDRIEGKINEIIDHLNSQDQEEEKPLKELEDNYLYSLRTANKPMSQDQEEEKIEYFDKGDKVRTYKSLEVSEKAYSEEPTVEDVYIEDTPEQKEELVEIKKKLNGISVEYNIIDRIDVIWEEIESLLSEREEFTKDELFMLKLATNDIHNKGNGAYDEIGEKIERMLSKLNKKK